MHTALPHRGSEAPPPAFFAITNRRTGEVMLELTSSSCAQPAAPVAGEESAPNDCCLFSDAFAFLVAAQAKSYELFGRNMARESNTRPSAAARGEDEQGGDPMGAYDVPGGSCLDSAEWEGDGAGTNDDGHEDEGGGGPDSTRPPSKRHRE
ncbi:uncharacterized protein Tco025E_08680 [Trypanosoma conorhini]|uniref:Uncharacterized protein n=1 Tax=Trypanosoma conorhini TaxID=83891 RepID=A0A422N7N6_9TRYP|nr:uncharacterized protein Tco025E_08680 [Trypanosoma conorhini]RNF01504.1 hypothetical protein Tco025E_08680 [Trypanosoma conorhini]